jgi:hypothetical protein
VSYFTRNGIKFAFVALADFNNNKGIDSVSVNIYHDQPLFDHLLRTARQNADVVLVSMHWGTEDSNEVNSDQRHMVEQLASRGADIVIGTGPHVLQKAERVDRPDGKRMFVWYSLGNLLSAQLQLPQRIGGIASMKVAKQPSGVSVKDVAFTPTFMQYEWTPEQERTDAIDERANFMVYPLRDAAAVMRSDRLSSTPADQIEYVRRTLGQSVTVR